MVKVVHRGGHDSYFFSADNDDNKKDYNNNNIFLKDNMKCLMINTSGISRVFLPLSPCIPDRQPKHLIRGAGWHPGDPAASPRLQREEKRKTHGGRGPDAGSVPERRLTFSFPN